ncbi:MAG: presqualene diphosphate synthase HpnD [Parvularculaceae bacterium]
MTASQVTMPLLTPEAAREHAKATVKRSGTSFAAGMSILSRERREGMHAIYAFCREVDDIADGDQSVVDKRLSLAAWRAEIDNLYAGKPRTPVGVALAGPVERYSLDRAEFILMIEGMEMDAEGPVVAPSMETLLAYTRRVAGAVGMLSMPVFGAPQCAASRDFALSLGDALQLTNILRDVGEDAAIGRLYLPRELLEKHGAPRDAASVSRGESQAGLGLAARDLGALAKQRFSAARAALASLDWRVVRPALLMMGMYEAYLKRLEARGWEKIGPSLSLSNLEKVAVTARHYFIPPRTTSI